MKRLPLFAFAVFAGAVAQGVGVSDVSASSRYPWSSVLDVDFVITAPPPTENLYQAEVTAVYGNDKKRLVGLTYLTEPIFGRGRNRISWNVGADYPDLKVEDLKVSVTVSPVNPERDVYMVIDLSSGPESKHYPVSYTFTAPTLVPTNDLVACAADPNRTTKLWLKRIKTSEFPFYGTDTNRGEGLFKVKLSPYYIGVFELTQQQWALVMDAWPSRFTNTTYRAARPVENVLYTDVIGHYDWPDNKSVTEDSFVGRMRARTGLSTFNLPTEAQWECACRSGDKNSSLGSFAVFPFRYTGSVLVAAADLTYNEGPDSGTALVGSYRANDWGLYDFYGNVLEMCLDAYVDVTDLESLYAGQNPVIDPIGPVTQDPTSYHAVRGGSWYNNDYCNNYSRTYGYNLLGKPNSGIGFRVAVSPEWK